MNKTSHDVKHWHIWDYSNTTTLDISGTANLRKLDGTNLSTVETIRLGEDQENASTKWVNFDYGGVGTETNITLFTGKLIVEGRAGAQTITSTSGNDYSMELLKLIRLRGMVAMIPISLIAPQRLVI